MPAQPPARLLLLLVFCVLSATLAAPAARADVAITGGTAAQRGQVAAVFAALPLCCRPAAPACVCLLGDSAMDSCLQACAAARSERIVDPATVAGFFNTDTGAITLRADPNTDVSATFAHEYGHSVWFHVLSPGQRDRFSGIYDAQRAAHHLVSPYAAVSVQEGFAEAFSFYICDRPLLASRDPLAERFLSDTLAAPAR